jgi:Na+-driven multidrug efflux pump
MLCTGILFSGQYAQMNALQSAGDSVGSLIISLSRQGLIFIPAAFILNAVAGLNGIVWAQPMSDLLSLILVVILYKRILPRIFKSGTVGV